MTLEIKKREKEKENQIGNLIYLKAYKNDIICHYLNIRLSENNIH